MAKVETPKTSGEKKPGGKRGADARAKSVKKPASSSAPADRKTYEDPCCPTSLLPGREAFLQGIMDNVAEGIVTTDVRGTVLSFNHAAEKMFGYAAAEIVGINIKKLMTAEDRTHHDKYLDDYLRTGEAKILGGGPRELTGRHKDGSEFPLELATSEVSHSGVTFFIGLTRDITERKKIENVLLTAKEEAEMANRTKSEFLANISHELRTPLNAIIGFSEMMQSEVLGPITVPQYKDYLEGINDSASLLLNIINEVLETSKAEFGALVLREQNFSLPQAIDICLKMVRERAKQNRIKISCHIEPDLPKLFADERLTKQILLNLLSNAIKFTPSGGKIHLKAGTNELGEILFSISDTGIGIAAKDIPKAMAPFGQVDSNLNREYEGTGLGLPLSKSFIELHEGKLVLESEVDTGTTVTITFPIHRTQSMAAL